MTSEDDDADTIPCPSCGKAIVEDVVRCPYCGEYVTLPSTSVLSGKPLWFIVLAIAGTLAFVFVYVL